MTDGVTPDQSYSKLHIANEARENDLFIFDLGYYGVEVFSKIAKKGAFFLTRFIHNTELYMRNGKSLKRIDFVSYLQSKKTMKFLEQQVYIGKKQLKCRLLAIPLPEKEKNERIRKIKMLAKKRSLKISKERIFLASWNIFVTNAPIESLPGKLVWPFYRLRWSIELIFKQFKSTLNIHCWNHENYHRLMCEIYGKLITATIIMFTHSRLQQHLWKIKEEEISFEKLFKFFKNNAYLLMEIVLGGNQKTKLFQKLIRQATRHNKACLQKSRPTTRQIIQSLS